jgi:hypothetical protein
MAWLNLARIVIPQENRARHEQIALKRLSQIIPSGNSAGV